jgi:hypothetical protein
MIVTGIFIYNLERFDKKRCILYVCLDLALMLAAYGISIEADAGQRAELTLPYWNLA